MKDNLPGLTEVQAAARRIGSSVNTTPVLRSRRLDAALGAELHFKCENLQRTGAFKIRGASNAVRSLDDAEAAAGVATHSSGNHGAALAAAASDRGITAHIVVPEGAVPSKLANIKRHGGRIIPCKPTLADRTRVLEEVVAESGATVIHPYNDPRIIAGQGTAGLELAGQVPGLDVVIVPVGGGGLISGCSIALKGMNPDIRVIGAEPAGADDAVRSLAAGEIIDDIDPDTIADGLRATIGPLTFALIREHVDRIVTMSDDEILAAMRRLWECLKIIVEPSSATVLAAAEQYRDELRGKRVGLILSGGNVDLDRIAFCARCGVG
ncbi:MAG: pyridoxal-phosphate dependent enzyme [Xanthomonadales bacterium]|nr:pyridoxal-phosphate dependent enzyme [Xanthomonadales bacterium]